MFVCSRVALHLFVCVRACVPACVCACVRACVCVCACCLFIYLSLVYLLRLKSDIPQMLGTRRMLQTKTCMPFWKQLYRAKASVVVMISIFMFMTDAIQLGTERASLSGGRRHNFSNLHACNHFTPATILSLQPFQACNYLKPATISSMQLS